MDRNEEVMDYVLTRLKEIWLRYPELRLAQLIITAFEEGELFYITDEEFAKQLAHRLDTDYKI